MIKSIILIVIVVGIVAYCNDPHSLDSWKQSAGELGTVTAKAVKSTGEELHKAAHADDTVVDTINNTVEDASSATKQLHNSGD